VAWDPDQLRTPAQLADRPAAPRAAMSHNIRGSCRRLRSRAPLGTRASHTATGPFFAAAGPEKTPQPLPPIMRAHLLLHEVVVRVVPRRGQAERRQQGARAAAARGPGGDAARARCKASEHG
jgi:hypothetical protein